MPKDQKPRVIALGFFDGLHRGHQAVIARAIELAPKYHASPCILTFDRRPKSLVSGQSVGLLSNRMAKTVLAERLFGAVEIIELPFDESLRQTSWQTFVQTILVERFGAVAAVCGENFRFGSRGEGTPELLQSVLPADIVADCTEGDAVVSSTRIRGFLTEGKLSVANKLLGHPHLLVGPVVHGDGRGAKLGFATLNLQLSDELLRMPNGVYASLVTLNGKTYHAITNFGTRPTFYENGIYDCETHVFDLNGDCYGAVATLELIAFLREERRFSSREALIEQIQADVETAKRCLQHYDEVGEPL